MEGLFQSVYRRLKFKNQTGRSSMIETRSYIEKVYAGVLGKIIGVYLGRPIEGWNNERILREIGEIHYYIHDKVGVPLIVTDDDITGTFTFIRAMESLPPGKRMTSKDVAWIWLNYIIENRTILWWGGKGISTEHTVYLSLKEGIFPPESGSIGRNGKTIAEQIGAQIFIDALSMVTPGDPEKTAQLTTAAAQVSHDGEAVYGAVIIAVMESLAFSMKDTMAILKKALTFVPCESIIYSMNRYIIELYQREPNWKKGWNEFRARYNYSKFDGSCHIIPNHGLIILSLLYGKDDFQKTQMIVNTCGWDTDCNAANAGCFLGIKNGLQGINDGPDFRTPVRDRLYLPSADGGRSINDAVTVTYQVVNLARKLKNLSPIKPKDGAFYHFSLPGSVQGFFCEPLAGEAPMPLLENRLKSKDSKDGILSCYFRKLSPGQTIHLKTATFIPPEARDMKGYEFIACPKLYPGNTLTARCRLRDTDTSVEASLFVQVNGPDDILQTRYSACVVIEPDRWYNLSYSVEETNGQPITFTGICLKSRVPGLTGSLDLDWLTWDSQVRTRILPNPLPKGEAWKKSWVHSLDSLDFQWIDGVRLSKNTGSGLFYQGTEFWNDYNLKGEVIPHLFKRGGLVIAVKGLKRYLALELTQNYYMNLVHYYDETQTLLGSVKVEFIWGKTCELILESTNGHLKGILDRNYIVEAITEPELCKGAAGITVTSGSISCKTIMISPTGM